MRKWEYTTQPLLNNEQFNDLGREGWELCNVIVIPNSLQIGYFKRPLTDEFEHLREKQIMKKWEYCYVNIGSDINILGKQGWELILLIPPFNLNPHRLLLKREIVEPNEKPLTREEVAADFVQAFDFYKELSPEGKRNMLDKLRGKIPQPHDDKPK